MSVLDVVRDMFAGRGRMSRADAELWWEARTLDDLAQRTALWLEGAVRSQPGYAANYGPDEETEHLVPVLAAANRAGFLTDQSQPGVPPEPGYDGETWCQRAAVSGFANAAMAQRIRDTCTAAGLIVHLHGPGDRRAGKRGTPVTTRANQTYTSFGRPMPARVIRFLYEDCHPDAVTAILAAHQVTVVDPVWGRDDHLWLHLTDAITWKDANHDH